MGMNTAYMCYKNQKCVIEEHIYVLKLRLILFANTAWLWFQSTEISPRT